MVVVFFFLALRMQLLWDDLYQLWLDTSHLFQFFLVPVVVGSPVWEVLVCFMLFFVRVVHYIYCDRLLLKLQNKPRMGEMMKLLPFVWNLRYCKLIVKSFNSIFRFIVYCWSFFVFFNLFEPELKRWYYKCHGTTQRGRIWSKSTSHNDAENDFDSWGDGWSSNL